MICVRMLTAFRVFCFFTIKSFTSFSCVFFEDMADDKLCTYLAMAEAYSSNNEALSSSSACEPWWSDEAAQRLGRESELMTQALHLCTLTNHCPVASGRFHPPTNQCARSHQLYIFSSSTAFTVLSSVPAGRQRFK